MCEKHKCKCKVDGNTSDGYHTFNELYTHRTALFAALTASNFFDAAFRCRTHGDGTMFTGMFMVMAITRDGKQVSYHIENECEHYFEHLPVFEKPPEEYDGHTSDDVVARLLGATELAASSGIERMTNDLIVAKDGSTNPNLGLRTEIINELMLAGLVVNDEPTIHDRAANDISAIIAESLASIRAVVMNYDEGMEQKRVLKVGVPMEKMYASYFGTLIGKLALSLPLAPLNALEHSPDEWAADVAGWFNKRYPNLRSTKSGRHYFTNAVQFVDGVGQVFTNAYSSMWVSIGPAGFNPLIKPNVVKVDLLDVTKVDVSSKTYNDAIIKGIMVSGGEMDMFPAYETYSGTGDGFEYIPGGDAE